MIAAIGAWLLTYLVHSTLLIAVAALVSTRVTSNGWRDTLWKVALVGGIVTTTVQMALGLEPVAGQHQLPGNVSAEVVKYFLQLHYDLDEDLRLDPNDFSLVTAN